MDDAEFERTFFTEFGESSLKFDISYYVNSADYTKYLEIREKINFAIYRSI